MRESPEDNERKGEWEQGGEIHSTIVALPVWINQAYLNRGISNNLFPREREKGDFAPLPLPSPCGKKYPLE